MKKVHFFWASVRRGTSVPRQVVVVEGEPEERRRKALGIAAEMGYAIQVEGVVSKYIGETEKNLRRLLARAGRGGSLLFFDEADSIFGRRTEVKDAHDRFSRYRGVLLLGVKSRRRLPPCLAGKLRRRRVVK